MKAVILAGGIGSRLRPFAEIIPKPLLPIGDQLIKNMIAEKIPVAKYKIHEYWLDIGQIADFEKAQEIYNEHFKDDKSSK